MSDLLPHDIDCLCGQPLVDTCIDARQSTPDYFNRSRRLQPELLAA